MARARSALRPRPLAARALRLASLALVAASAAALPAPATAAVERDPGFTGPGAPVGFAQDDFGTLAQATAIVALPNDGGVVVAGYGQDGTGRFIAVGRYSRTGAPDPLFLTRKYRPTDTSGFPNVVANGLVVDPDGAVTVVGTLGDGTSERLVLLRLTRTGNFDTTFGDPARTGGLKGYHVEPSTVRSTGRAILRRADGFIVAGAKTCTIDADPTHTCSLLQRYDEHGEVQTAQLHDAGLDPTGGLYAITGGRSSNVAAAGQVDSPTGNRTFGYTAVYNPSGVLISGSTRTTTDPSVDVRFRAITDDGAPTIIGNPLRGFIAVGTAGTQPIRRQFGTDGAPATTLPGGGELRLATPSPADGLAVARQTARRTIIAGVTAGEPFLARTNAGGAGLDTSFVDASGSGAAPGTIVETSFDRYSAWTALSTPFTDTAGNVVVYAAGTRTFAPLGSAFLLARYVVSTPPQAYLTFPAAKAGNVFGIEQEPSVDYIARRSPTGERLLRTEISWDGHLQYFFDDKEESSTLRLPKTGGKHTVSIKTTDAEGLVTERTVGYEKQTVDPAADEDGDGLSNGWELTGDIDGDGKQDLDLAAMGADYRHKDLFVRLDWMKDHQIDTTELAKVTAAFAAAPLTNPDGKTGVNLHLDHGSTSVLDSTGKTWGKLSMAKELTHQDSLGSYVDRKDPSTGKTVKDAAGNVIQDYDWSAFDKLRDANITALQRKVFRYSISIHKYAGQDSSGLARDRPADDFIVSMGNVASKCAKPKTECSWGTAASQARTVMHELGHTLGIGHGGTDSMHYKPNYLSLMNYLYQLPGTPTATANDGGFTFNPFTNAQITDLDESALSEKSGVTATGAAAGARSAFVCTGKKKKDVGVTTFTFGSEVDWNCDGTVNKKSSVSGDLTDDAKTTVLPTPTKTDWDLVSFKGKAVGSSGAGTPSGPARTLIDAPRATELQRLAQLLRKDSTKPTVTIRTSGALRAGKPITLRIGASDKRGLDRLQVTVDGKPVAPPALPPTRPLKVAPAPTFSLSRGRHVIGVIAIDSTGNLTGRTITLRVK